MHVAMRPIGEVKPYERNPRLNDGAVDAVAASLKEFGWRQPVVTDEDGIVLAGHTRLKAAIKLGWTQVPVHVARGLSPAQRRAYRLADNATHARSAWDMDLLPVELHDLEALEFDLSLLGFSPEDLAEIMAPAGTPEGLTGADDTPEPPKVALTQPGDLWLLEGHRLLCGDSTDADDVARLMDGHKAALCATDPPYLVDYTGQRPDRDGGNTGGKDWSATYREVDIPDAETFFRAVFSNVLTAIAPHAAVYCWHAHKRQAVIDRVWEDLGLLNHQQVIWVKPVAVFGRMFWHQRHEPCLMGWAKGSMPGYARDQSLEHGTVWEIDFEGKSRIIGNEHPTQKPVEIFARPMRRHTKINDICFEPFSGSGSQLIAAESLGRRCYGLELEPVFVDVAVRRWERYTGKTAKRFGPGGEELPGLGPDAPQERTPAGAGVEEGENAEDLEEGTGDAAED